MIVAHFLWQLAGLSHVLCSPHDNSQIAKRGQGNGLHTHSDNKKESLVESASHKLQSAKEKIVETAADTKAKLSSVVESVKPATPTHFSDSVLSSVASLIETVVPTRASDSMIIRTLQFASRGKNQTKSMGSSINTAAAAIKKLQGAAESVVLESPLKCRHRLEEAAELLDKANLELPGKPKQNLWQQTCESAVNIWREITGMLPDRPLPRKTAKERATDHIHVAAEKAALGDFIGARDLAVCAARHCQQWFRSGSALEQVNWRAEAKLRPTDDASLSHYVSALDAVSSKVTSAAASLAESLLKHLHPSNGADGDHLQDYEAHLERFRHRAQPHWKQGPTEQQHGKPGVEVEEDKSKQTIKGRLEETTSALLVRGKPGDLSYWQQFEESVRRRFEDYPHSSLRFQEALAMLKEATDTLSSLEHLVEEGERRQAEHPPENQQDRIIM